MIPNNHRHRSDPDAPSSHLWVGNLPFDVPESKLTGLFAKFGDIHGIHPQPSRNYAFVYYNRVEDAVAAKDALQGFLLDGNSVKIEFAKPAKPSKNVWVSGFSSSINKEKLEEELFKFGEVEDFKFNRDKNTALVNFVRLEDASAAVKSLNGLLIGDDRIRIDFLRSQPARREQSDLFEMGSAKIRGMGGFDSSWINPDPRRNYPEPTYSGHKRPQLSPLVGGRKSVNPSKVLWVGYPPSVVIDEEMLHNAMILHGEIEKIKCYPERHYSFVEFRSIEEARRAKEALEGILFNEPRIAIMFSNSNSAPGKDFGPPFSGFRGQRPDVVRNQGPFQPSLMDKFPPNSTMAPYGFSGPGMIRPVGPRGNLDPLLPTPDFYDHSVQSNMSDLRAKPPSGMHHRKLSPPGAGSLPSSALSGRSRHKTSGWDVLDPNHPPREPKRSRIGSPTFHDPSLRTAEVDENVDQPYGSDPPFCGGGCARAQAGIGSSLEHIGAVRGRNQGRRVNDDDYIWRGAIAKSCKPVCHARCIPIGNGLDFELPEVINCSARTGLDMLAKHYSDASGVGLVFFLPDSEDDFASYTEFLVFLGSKNRAGVAKLDDATTLFLVPPSDFVTDVLKVTGRERLYGVVLKLQPTAPDVAPSSQQLYRPLPHLQQMDRLLVPPTHEFAVPKQDFPVQSDYHSTVPEAAKPTIPPRVAYSTASVPPAQSNALFSSASGPALSLTPELIASLQSLQSAAQSSVAQSSVKHLSSSTTGPPVPISSNGGGAYSWSQQSRVHEHTVHSSQPCGVQPYPVATLANTFQSFSTNQNVYSYPLPAVPENMAMQNHAYNLRERGSVASMPAHMHPVTVQGQQFVPGAQGTQRYPFEIRHTADNNYATMHGTPAGSYSVAGSSQQPSNPGSFRNQLPERLQQVPSGVSQGTAEVEVGKKQEYQSTLQLAASLLLQIQQRQQQRQQQQGSSSMGNQL